MEPLIRVLDLFGGALDLVRSVTKEFMTAQARNEERFSEVEGRLAGLNSWRLFRFFLGQELGKADTRIARLEQRLGQVAASDDPMAGPIDRARVRRDITSLCERVDDLSKAVHGDPRRGAGDMMDGLPMRDVVNALIAAHKEMRAENVALQAKVEKLENLLTNTRSSAEQAAQNAAADETASMQRQIDDMGRIVRRVERETFTEVGAPMWQLWRERLDRHDVRINEIAVAANEANDRVTETASTLERAMEAGETTKARLLGSLEEGGGRLSLMNARVESIIGVLKEHEEDILELDRRTESDGIPCGQAPPRAIEALS